MFYFLELENLDPKQGFTDNKRLPYHDFTVVSP